MKIIRALVWKEWRESWWLLLLVVVVPPAWTIAAGISTDLPLSGTGCTVIAGLVVWGLALSLGAGLFAGERARGTEAFQHERPVGRGTIWNAKLILPALALVSGAILFWIIAVWLRPLYSWREIDLEVPFGLLVIWFLSFTSAALCSALLDRPLTAGAAGGVLSIVAVLGQLALFDHLAGLEGKLNQWHWTLLLCLLAAEAIGLLWLSRVVYVRWTHD